MKIILINIIIFTSALFAQDYLQRQYNHADNMFQNGLYYDAITEYKRLQFFDFEKKYSDEINYKIGLCYKHGAKFNEAIKYFAAAESEAVKIDDIYEIKTQIIRTNILRRTTDRAHQLLNNLEADPAYRDKLNDIIFWRGWNYMFADDWDKAAEAFAEIDPNHPLKILAEEVNKKQYSVTFTKFISYILPGSGEIYTGNYLPGLLSLSWNILWGYLTLDAFTHDRLFDGFAVGSLLWMRFYRGSAQNAEKFAIRENIKIANNTLRYIQNNYEGLKP